MMNNRLLVLIMVIILSLSLSLFSTTSGSEDFPGESSRQEVISNFVATNVLNQPGGSLAGGITLGDPDNDGNNEIIVVGGSAEAGRVTVVDYNASSKKWETPTIWIDSQALVDVEAADIDPFAAGEELIVGGYSRYVTILYWAGGLTAPGVNQIDYLQHQIFGLTAGDFNSSHSGLELAVVDGKSNNLTIYQSGNEKHKWEKHTLKLNETLRNVEAGDYDPAHAGDELIVLSSNGTVYSVINDNNDWTIERVWSDTDKLLDAAIGDADPRFDGNEIITVGLSKHTTLLRKSNTGKWNVTHLWTAPGGLEGLDIGEFDPSLANNEIAIGGYSRTVVMLYLDGDQWVAREIYQDKESSQSELNGVAIGEFYPAHKGAELMVVGASGVTTMLEYQHPDFTLSAGTTKKTVDAGLDAVFTIIVGTVSSFQGTVELNVNTELDWKLSEDNIDAPGDSTLTISTDDDTIAGEYEIEVTGKHGDEVKPLTLTVSVESAYKPGFNLNLSAREVILERLPEHADPDSKDGIYTDSITITIEAVHGFKDDVKLNVSGLPAYFEHLISIGSIYPGEESRVNVRIISNPPEDENEFTFTLTGTSGEQTDLEVVKVKLTPATVKDGNDTDSAPWVPQARIIMTLIIIILVIIIIVLRMYKYKSDQKIEENDKKDK